MSAIEQSKKTESGFEDTSGTSPQASSKRVFFRRVKTCPLEAIPAEEIDYKNLKLISRFVSERGRILPSRITAVSAKKQRQLARAIKRARDIALLPFVSQ